MGQAFEFGVRAISAASEEGPRSGLWIDWVRRGAVGPID
jgi:hypothetical protein